MQAIRLKTEFLTDPIGIDIHRPRLFWNCDGGVTQTAYEIVATDDCGNPLWESGKVNSSSMRCPWGGADIPAKTKVLWKVRLWDENDTCGPWSEATFETGMDTLRASWIAGDYKVNKKERYPVDCFRKCFDAKNIVKARLYITACGVYEAQINGQKCGNFVLAPGHTDYRKRIQYQTIDVTSFLTEGANTLTVQLADGWYRGSCGAWGRRNQYGTQTKLLAQLEITHADGSIQTIVSDDTWDWSNDGPIQFADNKDGEIIIADQVPSYKNKAKLAKHSVIPTASNNVPVTEHELFQATKLVTPAGKTVLDFGQNMAGYIAFSVKANAGDKIHLRFGETLDENGEFTQKNIQLSMKEKTTPLQQVIYTCKDGLNSYKTTFAIFGFRYVLVETDIDVRPEDFTAIAVYSDMEQTGFFDSSNDLLNQFFNATLWSTKSNSCDVPTDCPTRERHGWTGDAQIFCSTASYLFNYYSFGNKYLHDVYDWQKKNGKLPQIAPEGGVDFYMASMNGCVGWADAGVIIPYTLWKQYGDISILQTYIDGMRKHAAFMQRRLGKWYPTAKPTGLHGKARKYICNYGQAYGEWAEPADIHPNHWTDCVVPHPEVNTAYTVYVMELMAEIETVLGNHDRACSYLECANNCRSSYQALMETKNFSLDTPRQARLVRPLYFNLLNEQQESYAKERLIQALEGFGWRIGTGFLSTPLILDVLTQIDLSAAYKLLENEAMPGWLFMTKNGSTTVWEAWEGNSSPAKGIGSLNHYSKGAVCRWLFDTMCGIRMGQENRFVIAPHPGGSFTHADARYTSVYGTVESSWKASENGYECTITIPSNCEALVCLPNGTQVMQKAGTKVYLI